MQKYRVVERRAEQSRMTVRCGAGRYHVARALSLLPELDQGLEGNHPHLGFGILLCQKTGEIFRVIFESVGNAEIRPTPNAMPLAAYRLQAATYGAFSGAAGVS